MQIIACLKLPRERLKRLVERSTMQVGKIASNRPIRHTSNRKPGAARGRECSTGHYGEIAVPAWGRHTVILPCSRIRR